MTWTAPMGTGRRMSAYRKQTGRLIGRRLTPRQERRIRHKENHARAPLVTRAQS